MYLEFSAYLELHLNLKLGLKDGIIIEFCILNTHQNSRIRVLVHTLKEEFFEKSVDGT
jgi:hypothetical protein